MWYLGIDWGIRRAAWCALGQGGELEQPGDRRERHLLRQSRHHVLEVARVLSAGRAHGTGSSRTPQAMPELRAFIDQVRLAASDSAPHRYWLL